MELAFGQERFLEDEPNNLLRMGNFSKVSVMIGVTADEFSSPVAGQFDLINRKYLEAYDLTIFSDPRAISSCFSSQRKL